MTEIEIQGKAPASSEGILGSNNAGSKFGVEALPNESQSQKKIVEKPSKCPECGSRGPFSKASIRILSNKTEVQRWLCKCGLRFSAHQMSKTLRAQHYNTSNSQVCVIIEETKNLEPQPNNEVVAISQCRSKSTPNQGLIIQLEWYLKKQGYSDATAHTRVKALKFMDKNNANLLDPEAVKLFICRQKTWSDGHKQLVVMAYDSFAKMLKIQWDPPVYDKNKTLPFIPTEKEVDALVSGCSTKVATCLLALKETGFRIGELWRCKWTDLDEENSTLKCIPEKHGDARQLKISSRLIAMLLALRKTSQTTHKDFIFGGGNLNAFRWRYDQQKTALSIKLQNPRLKQIKFHTFRHFKASREYAETRNILHVKELLGHRNINSTLVYTHLVPFDDEAEAFNHATAKNETEAGELLDQAWQYVCTTPQGIMMFRKAKKKR